MADYELYHWGVKGMKWGVRRYQKADGSLTPAGRKRYAEPHEDYQRAHSKKSIKQMSDKELRDRNNRLQMERQYEQFTKKKGRGKAIVQAFIATAGTITAAQAAYKTYAKLGNSALNSIGDFVLKSIDLNNLVP